MQPTTITPEEIEARISALEEAIVSGARRIVFNSGGTRREIEYNSLSDMFRALEFLKSQRPGSQKVGMRTLASYSSNY